DCTAELIVRVANSVVFSSAISINVGLIPLSISHILRKMIKKNKHIVNIKMVRTGGGDFFVGNRKRRLCKINIPPRILLLTSIFTSFLNRCTFHGIMYLIR